MNALTRAALWQRLRDAELVQGDMPASAPASSPWYVRAMLGAAGWLGALFLLGFIGVAFAAVVRTPSAAITLGLLCCAGAFLTFRVAGGNAFVAQFGLATSLAGQALVVFGIAETLERDIATACFAVFALEAVLAAAVPDFTHRVLTTWAGAAALAFGFARLGVSSFAPALTAAALAGVWLNERRWLRHDADWRPIGYGLALAMVQIHAQLLLGGAAWLVSGPAVRAPMLAWWIGRVAVAAVFVYAVARLLGSRAALAAVVLAALLSPAPGSTTALLLLLLGFAAGDRVLLGLGCAALVGFVSHYYYQMQATLLAKSGVLFVTGALLLLARTGLRRLVQEEPSRA